MNLKFHWRLLQGGETHGATRATSHQERYARTEEFLAICHDFWNNYRPVNFNGEYHHVENSKLNTPFVSPHRQFPELFVAGGSEAARNLAISQGTLWMRMADTPENLRSCAAPVLAAGKEVGLRMSIIARPCREEAVRAAYDLIAGLDPSLRDKEKEREFMLKSDSVGIRETYALAENEWLTPWLWTGAVRTHGAPGIALVGSPPEIAQALIEYKRAGVTQFIFSGWPKLEEIVSSEERSCLAYESLKLNRHWSRRAPNRLLPGIKKNSNE